MESLARSVPWGILRLDWDQMPFRKLDPFWLRVGEVRQHLLDLVKHPPHHLGVLPGCLGQDGGMKFLQE